MTVSTQPPASAARIKWLAEKVGREVPNLGGLSATEREALHQELMQENQRRLASFDCSRAMAYGGDVGTFGS